MSVKLPLVVGANGRPEQLQTADTLGGSFAPPTVPVTVNGDSLAGQAMYISAANTVSKAQANATSTSVVAGLLIAGALDTTTGNIQSSGPLELTTGQWDAVCGTTGGLTPGTTYYLDPATAGMHTSTVPTTVGQSVTLTILAISSTKALIKLSEPILL